MAYTIGTQDSMSWSERTYDILAFDMARNTKLLHAMHLVADMSGTPDAVQFFVFYLSSFSRTDVVAVRHFLDTNPVLRIVITDHVMDDAVREALRAYSFAQVVGR